MSELKAYTFSAMERIGLADYYLKSEADKVIAELKSDIADLRDDKKTTDAILNERNYEIAKLKEQVALLQAEFIPEPGV